MNDSLHTPGSAENPEDVLGPKAVIRDVRLGDLGAIQPVLEQWVVDSETGHVIDDEVDGILAAVKDSIEGKNDRKYIVAENNNGGVAGIMGMSSPDEDMLAYTQTEQPIELINAFVDRASRGTGLGKQLTQRLEQMATESGSMEIIVNSGPRYRDSGWDFWTRMYGEPVAIQKDLYGPGRDAPVWRQSL